MRHMCDICHMDERYRPLFFLKHIVDCILETDHSFSVCSCGCYNSFMWVVCRS